MWTETHPTRRLRGDVTALVLTVAVSMLTISKGLHILNELDMAGADPGLGATSKVPAAIRLVLHIFCTAVSKGKRPPVTEELPWLPSVVIQYCKKLSSS